MEKLNYLNNILNKVGFKLEKYTPVTSNELRLKEFFKKYKINFVIDVGANIGNYGKMLRKLGYTGKIISFEPLKFPYDILYSRYKKDKNWIIPPRMAIGNSNGKIEINISKNIDSSSILNMNESHRNAAPNSFYTGKEIVDIRTLDSLSNEYLFNIEKNLFIKIDVQGYEFQVLEGAVNLINRIKGIQIELSLSPLYEGQKLYREIIDYLEDKGFILFAIIPGFSDENTGQTLQFDGLFKRQNNEADK